MTAPTPDKSVRDIARKMANGSIVSHALACLIEQILTEVSETEIGPLRAEVERLRSALQYIEAQARQGYPTALAVIAANAKAALDDGSAALAAIPKETKR